MAGSGEVLTYRELDERSNRLAHELRAQGLRRGDHVALFMENHVRYMEIVWAALRSGIYITAINSFLTAPEVAYIVDDCDARLVLSSRAKADVAASIDPATTPKVERWLMVDGVATDLGGPAWESYEDAVAGRPATTIDDESSGALMLYSSGTTGRPKGIKRPLPDDPIDVLPLRMTAYTIPTYSYDADMVYLSPAPMYHAAPLVFSLAVHRVGGTLVIMEKFDAGAMLANIERFAVTHTQVVPTMFVRMLKLGEAERTTHDLSTLQVAIHAAAPCPVDVKRRMIEWWGPVLLEYYAGTEGNGATFINSEEWLTKPGSVGKVQGVNIHICDPDGNDLPAGEIGGVYFSGGGAYEYHKDPAKTADAALPGGRTTLGDVGYIDEDGYLFLTDRKAHMIISGGVNIYPQEAEDVLIGHPSVADVAVIGVPDEEMGEQVKAVVQPVDGVEVGAQLEAELIAYTRERLATFKCPRSIDFEDELPRLPTGKLYKRILRDRYWGKPDGRIV
jgi:acyl-CoA synthetase (AMP-forming)/AMP-acid ligase II